MYRINKDSNQLHAVRKWILTILQCLVELPAVDYASDASRGDNKSQARDLEQDLAQGNEFPFSYPYPYLLSRRLPKPWSSSLLKEVNNTPEIDLHLERLWIKRIGEYKKLAEFIPPMSKTSVHAPNNDNLVPLDDGVTEFVASNREVMLILGDSGAGKSTFNEWLEHDMWTKYKPGGWIPLFIDLKLMDRPDQDVMRKHLHDLGMFKKDEIDEPKSRRFLLICDGYGECRKWFNLHKDNRLNQSHQWKAKVVISCRSQYLVSKYHDFLVPEARITLGSSQAFTLYEEAVIVPFDQSQIRSYICLYRMRPETQVPFVDQPVWNTDEYLSRLTPLMELVSNSFLLKLVLDILPTIADGGYDLVTSPMTLAELYDVLIDRRFENE